MSTFFEEKDSEVMKYRFDDPKRAYDICREILDHGIQEEEWYEVAYAYLYMGDTLLSLGRMSEAIDCMLMGEKIQKKYGYDDLLMKGYNITAIIYMVQSDNLLALDYYYKAMEIAKKHKNYVMLGMIYNNIGVLIYNNGDAVAAAEYFEKGIEISHMKGEEDEGLVYNECQSYVNISGKYIELGDYMKAKEYLDKAVKEHKCDYIRIARINIIAAYAIVYYRMSEYELAYRECMKIFDDEHSTFFEIESYIDYTDIAGVLVDMGYTKDAKRLLKIMEKVCEKEYTNARRKELCIRYIELYSKENNKEMSNYWCKEYYKVSEKCYEELRKTIITSIDNRQKLEDERVINIELSEDNKELVKESQYDELTGINNRYGLTKEYNILNEEAYMNGYSICLAIFDIDYFKIYNDSYGHLAGDECLKSVANILKKCAGKEYYKVRYGGDEFIIMGINKSDNELKQFVDRLFDAMAKAHIKFGEHPLSDRVTISLGAVNVSAGEEYDISEFIHSADSALYKVKQNGKNSYYITDSL